MKSPLWPTSRWVSLLTVLSLGVLGTVMILGLEKFALYFPTRALETTPSAEDLWYEDVWFPATDGVMLHGWLIPAPRARVTIVWFHGNAGNIGDRVVNIGYLHRVLQANVFIFDYRGYGQSHGTRLDLSEEATYRDGLGALAYLRTRTDLTYTRLVYFGRSLGAAIAVEMARAQPPAGLILETAFTTLKDVARFHYPLIPLALLRTRYDSIRKIAEVRTPVLILHGDRDEVVPLEHARRLYAAANAPKQLYIIGGAHHNDTYVVGGSAYFDVWAGFLRSLVSPADL